MYDREMSLNKYMALMGKCGRNRSLSHPDTGYFVNGAVKLLRSGLLEPGIVASLYVFTAVK